MATWAKLPAGLAIAALLLVAPTQAAPPPKPKPPAAAGIARDADGHPDLGGIVWGTPYQGLVQAFPTAPAQLYLPEAEAKAAYDRMTRQIVAIPNVAIDAEAVSLFTEADGFPVVRGKRQTRMVVQPANGVIPMTAEAAKATAFSLVAPGEKFDNPEDRPPGERCLSNGSLPPMALLSFLHPRQLLVTRQAVAIHVEYGDEVRVIPFADHHEPAALAPPNGDSIARWEGDTLVIETTHNPAWARLRPFPVGLVVNFDARIIERFTLIAPNELLYQFTVEDPKVYTGPWLAEYSLYPTGFRMFPSNCHEGNYSLVNILSAAREAEKAKAVAKAP